MGYWRAGFCVKGVDLKSQPRYPFEFHQADAMTYPLDGFDAVHASPPCQAYSQGTLSQRKNGKVYADLVAGTRDRLIANGVPFAIENVPGAPVRGDFILCGSMFALRLVRHRLFEMWPVPEHLTLLPACSHDRWAVTVTGHGTPSYVRNSRSKRGIVREDGIDWKRECMGIDWMNRDELSQSIPPAYTEFIGKQLMAALAYA